jgi:hypothetical protein
VISMSNENEIETVKSPFVTREKASPYTNISPMIINVKLSNGIMITEPGQFDSGYKGTDE